jgi:tRNA pseudouridine38-40 synthase
MSNIKLILEYDGAGFCGWQKQSGTGLRTVQGVLETALEQLTGAAHRTAGAGRTDAGVHALGQVASFTTEFKLPAERWPAALNGLLPTDLAARSAETVDASFHARRSAGAKEYCYLFLNRQQRSAIWHRYSCLVPQRLDLERMARGADLFRGTHDFAAFSATGSSAKRTVRQIFSSSVFRSGDLVGFRVAANGFLYKMVRLMAGMLVEIGTGRAEPGRIVELLESSARGRGGPVLPPQGLFLVRITYGDLDAGQAPEAAERAVAGGELSLISKILGV